MSTLKQNYYYLHKHLLGIINIKNKKNWRHCSNDDMIKKNGYILYNVWGYSKLGYKKKKKRLRLKRRHTRHDRSKLGQLTSCFIINSSLTFITSPTSHFAGSKRQQQTTGSPTFVFARFPADVAFVSANPTRSSPLLELELPGHVPPICPTFSPFLVPIPQHFFFLSILKPFKD